MFRGIIRDDRVAINRFIIDMAGVQLRSFFQVHLSTALILTSVAGVFVGLNFGQRKRFTDADYKNPSDYFVTDSEVQFRQRLTNLFSTTRNYETPIKVEKSYGWPYCFSMTRVSVKVGSVAQFQAVESTPTYFSLSDAVVDVWLGIVALVSVGVVCEMLIRRSRARKS